MQDKTTTNRREALGLASLAAAFVIGGPAAEARPEGMVSAARPGAAELERAKRLYGGELGGCRQER